jgi:hypothetical protein
MKSLAAILAVLGVVLCISAGIGTLLSCVGCDMSNVYEWTGSIPTYPWGMGK